MLNNTAYEEYLNSHPIDNHQYIHLIHNFMCCYCPTSIFSLHHFIPTYTLNEKVVLQFHVYKHHIGIFPGLAAVQYIQHRLSRFRSSKRAIQIPKSVDFPFEIIKDLIDFNLKD